MIELDTLLLFMGASFLLALSPGPDIIYVITQGITKGAKPAIITSLGLTSGILIHTVAAALGISVIFETSQIAFNIVKFLGAFYLFYLGYMAFKHRADLIKIDEKSQSQTSLRGLYAKGFLMNVLNPKVSLFFLAFLPQFVSPQNGIVPLQMIQLGIAFIVVTIIVFSTCGILANKGSAKLMEISYIAIKINIISSLIFLCFVI